MNKKGSLKVKCRICNKILTGRSDKLFCSVRCKNYYHTNLRRVTNIASVEIDEMLHRNRSILLEIMGKNSFQKRVNRSVLERKKFHFNYLTHFYLNRSGKMYHWIYDFAWMSFSDDEVLIVKKQNRTNNNLK